MCTQASLPTLVDGALIMLAIYSAEGNFALTSSYFRMIFALCASLWTNNHTLYPSDVTFSMFGLTVAF